jgi:hypothetical protein
VGLIRRRGSEPKATEVPASSRKPLARSDELVVEELGDELLVYDLTADRAHSLGAAAAQVWRACDGTRSVEALSAELGLDGETIGRALDELSGCNLLDEPALGVGTTRREATVRLVQVGAAAAATPLIVSLGLPATAAATVPIEVCANDLTHGCGIDCSPHDGSKCGCCCCQGTSDQLRPLVCHGDDKCCLPKTQCQAGAFGASANCSDVSCCSGQSPCN